MITDQIHYSFILPKEILSIVSLVPSQTEFLFSIGLGSKIKGVTKFCIHPSVAKKNSQIVGGTKNVNFESIAKINPDIIIANKEENSKEQIEELKKRYNVWTSDIKNIDDAYNMMKSLGKIFKKEQEVNTMINQIKNSFQNISIEHKTGIYLIWHKPMMVAGSDTFISEMMKIAGIKNLIKGSRYPRISLKEIELLKPNYVLLSSEPFPFNEKHLNHYSIPNAKTKLVDGTYFSWYGSRLSDFSKYIQQEFR